MSDAFKDLAGQIAEHIEEVAPKKKKKKVQVIDKTTDPETGGESDAAPSKKSKVSKPPIHVLVYGDAGSMKSTFAATFPKPMLVFCFDPFGKDMPYKRKGAFLGPKLAHTTQGNEYRVGHVIDKEDDSLLIQIEYYHDIDPTKPKAWRTFLERFAHSADLDSFKTVVFDSTTFMQLAKFYDAKYKQNPTAKDPRQWYMAAKESLEELLMCRVAGMYQNVVLIAHVNEEKDEVHGGFVYNPAVPGKLSKGLPAGYAEFYRAYVKTEDGKNVFYLQTEKSAQYNAASQLPAPNPCTPSYKALWEHWKG